MIKATNCPPYGLAHCFAFNREATVWFHHHKVKNFWFLFLCSTSAIRRFQIDDSCSEELFSSHHHHHHHHHLSCLEEEMRTDRCSYLITDQVLLSPQWQSGAGRTASPVSSTCSPLFPLVFLFPPLLSSLSIFRPVHLLLHRASAWPLLSSFTARTPVPELYIMWWRWLGNQIPTWNRLTVSLQRWMGCQHRALQITRICAAACNACPPQQQAQDWRATQGLKEVTCREMVAPRQAAQRHCFWVLAKGKKKHPESRGQKMNLNIKTLKEGYEMCLDTLTCKCGASAQLVHVLCFTPVGVFRES